DATPTDFCVGCSGYPEKHFEAPNLDTDVRRTKEKVDAGAEYIVTQMFFDNRHYFDFVARCRAAGITVPIVPGLKVLTSKKQVVSIARTFHCEIPDAFTREIESAKPEHQQAVGVQWALEQTRDLLAK